MGYVKFWEGLPKIAKIILAIIPFTEVLGFTVSRIIKTIVNKQWVGLVLSIVFGLPLGIVSWVLDIVFTITKDQPVDYVELFNLK